MWDNLGAHKSGIVRAAVLTAGHQFLDRPAYSPDFAWVENCFSKLKGILRGRMQHITLHTLRAEITAAVHQITSYNVQGYAAHCHYFVPGRPYKPYDG